MLVPREIFALENVADTDSASYALGGVKFYRSVNGKPMACATDGRRAIIAQWDEDDPSEYPSVGVCDPSPNGGKFEVIIGVDACKRIPKMAPKAKRSAKPILRNIVLDEHSLHNNMLGVGATDLDNPEVTSIKVLEGRYPRIHDVVPRVDDECTSVILDGKLLLGMLQSLTKIVENEGTCKVTFTFRGHESPVLMTAHDNEKRIRTVGVLMPLYRGKNPPKPGWLPADDEAGDQASDQPGEPDEKALKLAERLEGFADAMQKEIDAKQAPMTQNATPKRLRQYRSRLREATNLENGQRALRALAAAYREGRVPEVLTGLKTKKDILPLVEWDMEMDGNGDYQQVIGKYRDDSEQGRALQQLLEAGKSDGDKQAEADRQEAEEVERLKNELRFQKIPGFFPTPDPVIDAMLEHADIQYGQRVLEPSAGIGSITDKIAARWKVGSYYPANDRVSLTAVEIRPKLAEIIEKAETCSQVACSDFLEMQPESYDKFDRIVMNPPFEKGQDIQHVSHAFGFLKPGGRLVALMSPGSFSNSGKRFKLFQEWLDTVDHEKHELPEGSFTGGEAFRSTGVNPVMVVIDRSAVDDVDEGDEGNADNQAEQDPVDAALGIALRGFQGADDRWAKLRKQGASDAELKKAIAAEFGIGGGHAGPGQLSSQFKGGANPAFEIKSKKLKLTGKALIRKVRELMEIPVDANTDEPEPAAEPEPARSKAKPAAEPIAVKADGVSATIELVKDLSVRVFGGRGKGKFDHTFKVGDKARYPVNGDVHVGKIMKIKNAWLVLDGVAIGKARQRVKPEEFAAVNGDGKVE